MGARRGHACSLVFGGELGEAPLEFGVSGAQLAQFLLKLDDPPRRAVIGLRRVAMF